MMIDGRLLVTADNGELSTAKPNQHQLRKRTRTEEANLTEHSYKMRAVVDSGCTRTLVPHPQFCVDGSVKKLAEPVHIKGLGGIVKSMFTGTLRIKSNVPGCNRSITIRNVITSSTLVCVSELDDMGYKS